MGVIRVTFSLKQLFLLEKDTRKRENHFVQSCISISIYLIVYNWLHFTSVTM